MQSSPREQSAIRVRSAPRMRGGHSREPRRTSGHARGNAINDGRTGATVYARVHGLQRDEACAFISQF
jgi:hypothetical protein